MRYPDEHDFESKPTWLNTSTPHFLVSRNVGACSSSALEIKSHGPTGPFLPKPWHRWSARADSLLVTGPWSFFPRMQFFLWLSGSVRTICSNSCTDFICQASLRMLLIPFDRTQGRGISTTTFLTRALSRLRQCIKAVESGKEQQWLMPSRFADYQAGKPITVVVVFTNSCSAASTHIAHVCWLCSPLFFMPSN